MPQTTLEIEINGTAWIYALNMTALGAVEDGATVSCTTLVDEDGDEVPTTPDIWPLTLPLISDSDHIDHLAERFGDEAPTTGKHYGARITGVTTWPAVGTIVTATITATAGSDSRTVYPKMRVVRATGTEC